MIAVSLTLASSTFRRRGCQLILFKTAPFAKCSTALSVSKFLFFQRGYAWEKRQWDQLFVDLQEQIIDEINKGSGLDEVEHFFGPIVVLERAGGAVELKNFLVIDGQQRITTMYLLLSVIRKELETKKHLSSDAGIFAEQIKRIIVNEVSGGDDYLKLKLFSSKGDRLPTYWTVFGHQSNPKTPLLQTDLQLYVPSNSKIDEFKRYAEKKLKSNFKDVPALWQLTEVILQCLKIVWIPLSEGKDDPQAIFESLNDKGMPLKASELLCNFIFKPVIEAGMSFEDLHNNQWLSSIKLLDGDDSFEDYLRNLLSIGESKMVGKGRKIYVHFKAKNRNMTAGVAKQHLEEIYLNAQSFLSIRSPRDNPHSDNIISETLIAISDTRMDSSTPFVLALLRSLRLGAISVEQSRKVLNEVLVLLTRRKMAELPTTQYDIMFPQLFSKIEFEPDKIKALQDQFRKNNVWVSDQEFEYAFVHKALYRSRDLAFARMVLVSLDKSLQKFGQLPDYSTVSSIEHMLPQTLDGTWKKYLGEESIDERLPLITDTVGNLCLLSGPANSSAGQNPFEAKQEAYMPITALARQFKDHPGPWNQKSIIERSQALAKQALEIWAWSLTA